MKKHDPRNCVVGVHLPDGKQLNFVEPVSVWRAISVGAKAGALTKGRRELVMLRRFFRWLFCSKPEDAFDVWDSRQY